MLPQRKANKRGGTVQGVAYKLAPQQEKRIARKLGGKVTKASGSQREKGDVRVQGLVRVEGKVTAAKGFRVTLEMLDKIEDAAANTGEVPVIAIDFVTPEGKPLRSVYVVPADAMEDLLKGVK